MAAPTRKAPPKRRPLPAILAAVVVAALAIGVWIFLRGILSGGTGSPKKVVQEVHLIRPPPPPPDEPPPPPPPPEEKTVDIKEPDQAPDPTPSNEPPPSEQLGLDAEGGAGSDAFGLAGHKGGRDLLATGGSAFAWYAGLLKNEISEQLGNEKRARGGDYSVVVRVWVREDGSIARVNVVQSSGDRERDQAIEAAVSRLSRLPQSPPPDMPQPISLRIVSRA